MSGWAVPAAYGFAALAFLAVAFQAALALGAPWGELTWGGRVAGRLPPAMRSLALATAALLAIMAQVVMARAGVPAAADFAARWLDAYPGLIWWVVGYCALGVVANAATPSRRERRLWLPVAAAMFCCALAVALA